MSSKDATTNVSFGVSGLHVRALEHFVFCSNKVDMWKLYKLTYILREIQVAMTENCLGDDTMKVYQGMQFQVNHPRNTEHP